MAGKKARYSLDAMIPHELMQKIPYKHVYEALSLDDEQASEEALDKLLVPFSKISMWNAYDRFQEMESNRDKKNLMRSHVYLDALLRLQRLPNQVNKSVGQLVEQTFSTIDAETLELILDQFT